MGETIWSGVKVLLDGGERCKRGLCSTAQLHAAALLQAHACDDGGMVVMLLPSNCQARVLVWYLTGAAAVLAVTASTCTQPGTPGSVSLLLCFRPLLLLLLRLLQLLTSAAWLHGRTMQQQRPAWSMWQGLLSAANC